MITLGQPVAPDLAILHQLIGAITASGRWTNGGATVRELEHVLSQDLGSACALTTASGTTALTLALLACDLPRGGEVITSPLTFPATVHAIEAAGLVPVFAGVDPVTLNLAADAACLAIGPRTVAILPVHLFGIAADPEFDDIAAAAGLAIVYDAAHAYGLPGISARGSAAAYSLHATKLMHTGEGGLVTTSDPEFAERLSLARNFGLVGDRALTPGTNGKLSELSAALGLAVHAGLAREIQSRRATRDAYQGVVEASERVRPHAPGCPRALVMEAIRCDPDDQEQLLADLAQRGIAGRRFPALTAENQRYSRVPLIGGERADLDRVAASVLAIPLHGRVTQQAIDAVAHAVRAAPMLIQDASLAPI